MPVLTDWTHWLYLWVFVLGVILLLNERLHENGDEDVYPDYFQQSSHISVISVPYDQDEFDSP